LLRKYLVIICLLFYSVGYGEPLYLGSFPVSDEFFTQRGTPRTNFSGKGDIYGKNKDVIVFVFGDSLLIYEFINGQWSENKRFTVNRQQFDFSNTNRFRGVIVDLNNNGFDEIYGFYDKKVDIIEWNGKEFQYDTWDFPVLVTQAFAGDIDNDNEIELVTLSVQEPMPERNKRGKLDLIVWELKENGFTKVWCDSGSLDFTYDRMIPPSKIHFIGDPVNSGINLLTSSIRQSDVSPTTYIYYKWDGSGLREVTRLKYLFSGDEWPDPFISKNTSGRIRVVRADKNNWRPAYISGSLSIEKFENDNLVIGFLVCEKVMCTALMKIKGSIESGDWEVIQFVDERLGKFQAFTICADIDGKGSGLLTFNFLEKVCKFERPEFMKKD